MWAPGIFFDEENGDYIIHWSSSSKDTDYDGLSIFYSRTKDFQTFSEPKLFYRKSDSETLDSCIYKENGVYHFFVKSADHPKAVIHETSRSLFGTYERDREFTFPYGFKHGVAMEITEEEYERVLGNFQ